MNGIPTLTFAGGGSVNSGLSEAEKRRSWVPAQAVRVLGEIRISLLELTFGMELEFMFAGGASGSGRLLEVDQRRFGVALYGFRARFVSCSTWSFHSALVVEIVGRRRIRPAMCSLVAGGWSCREGRVEMICAGVVDESHLASAYRKCRLPDICAPF